jgi:hypothetical protein
LKGYGALPENVLRVVLALDRHNQKVLLHVLSKVRGGAAR